jgi:hypothetical protein
MQNSDEPGSQKLADRGSEVCLVVPWRLGGSGLVQSICRASRNEAKHFVSERSRVHETYIREQEKTKRLSLILAAACLIAGCVVIVFGPHDREMLSNWVGAALVIVSAGAAGYTRIWAKRDKTSFGADSGSAR